MTDNKVSDAARNDLHRAAQEVLGLPINLRHVSVGSLEKWRVEVLTPTNFVIDIGVIVFIDGKVATYSSDTLTAIIEKMSKNFVFAN